MVFLFSRPFRFPLFSPQYKLDRLPRLFVHVFFPSTYVSICVFPCLSLLRLLFSLHVQVISSNQTVVTKIFALDRKLWAPEPGPLKVVTIDTGAGPVVLNPVEGGVVVAMVQADLDGHGITVANHESLRIYQSTKSIEIIGSGFVDGNTKAKAKVDVLPNARTMT